MTSRGYEWTVEIVLATYNGEAYLAEQLDSLLAQKTSVPWRVLVADDGSQDRSCEIVTAYASRDPRIVLLSDSETGRGPAGRFGWLAAQTKAPYVMFCDQDDVWLPHKVQQAFTAMQAAETSKLGLPVLLHTDLQVVDRNLGEIASSFIALRGIDPTPPLRRLLVENSVTGCTVMVNRPLLQLALPIPSHAYIHDWWLALLAESCGRLVYLPEASIRYRQHEANTVGVRRVGLYERVQRFWELWGDPSAQRMYERSYAQAQALLTRAASHMHPQALQSVTAFVASNHAPVLSKKWQLLRGGFLQKHPLRRVLLLLRIR